MDPRRALVRAKSIEARLQNRLRRLTAPIMARTEVEVSRIQRRFHSPLHSEWLAAVMGIVLGVSFSVCFLTGMVDYLAQHPPYWFHLPVRPINLFRVTEGGSCPYRDNRHSAAACEVVGRLSRISPYPPVRSVAHALERLSLVPLVGGALFELATGVANIAYWYSPMPFNFTTAHFYVAWITIGGLIVHIGAKLSLTREVVSGRHTDAARASLPSAEVTVPVADPPVGPGLSRRGFLVAVGGGAGVLLLTVAGETRGALAGPGHPCPSQPTIGPQRLPGQQDGGRSPA